MGYMSEIIAGTLDKQNRDFAGKNGIKAGKCDFPFLHKGYMHNECVEHQSKGMWCPTEPKIQTKKKTPIKTISSKKVSAGFIDRRNKNFEGIKGYSSGECQFPFLYKGEMKEECQNHPEKGLWCAT